MNCPNCGGTVPPGVNRCVKCGSYVEHAAPPPPQMVPQQMGPQPFPQQYVAVPQPQAAGPPVKSKIAAGLFGIFLGGLGIHRFYLGYTGIGLLQLLLSILLFIPTCGVSAMAMGIWGLIEGILILAGSFNRDAQGRPLLD